jgi:hypothetical protein
MLTQTEVLIQKLYHDYRQTVDIDRKGLFFSPECMQICRPIPSYAATTRAQIVQYCKDAQEGNVPVDSATRQPSGTIEMPEDENISSSITENTTAAAHEEAVKDSNKDLEVRDVYTIRPLRPNELRDFSDVSVTSFVGSNPDQLLQKSQKEEWVGMRVDLWNEGVTTDHSLLVKVHYWWRKEETCAGEELEGDIEGMGWRQCLHDIMYLGPKDGTQGEEGLEVKEQSARE